MDIALQDEERKANKKVMSKAKGEDGLGNLFYLRKSLVNIMKIKTVFVGHVRRLPGGGAGAGQVQREGARRPYCRHSYQCIHR